jgi:hypothetical protein
VLRRPGDLARISDAAVAGVKALLATFRAVECPRSVADSLGLTALAHNPAANGREAHISGAIAGPSRKYAAMLTFANFFW